LNRIIITEYKNMNIAMFINNDQAIKARIFDSFESRTGQVYLGRVKNVKKNISASFINYNNGKIGFINNSSRKPETVFPVMIKKHTSGDKEDVLTDKITLSGLYCVVGNDITGIKKSKRLSECELSFSGLNNSIIRVNAANIDIESVNNEYSMLRNLLDQFNEYSSMRTEDSILYNGIPELISFIFSEDLSEYTEILTDNTTAFDVINSFIAEYSKNDIKFPLKLRLYEDKLLPLSAFISISSKLERAFSRKVFLKSDAYIVIDYTEAMTVIDVNTGTTKFKGNKQEVFHKINLEAADEIALQLKLRNISGIIIVDFINVHNKDLDFELISQLKNRLKVDDSNARCHGITKLGLVEITRDRKDIPLREQILTYEF